MIDFTKNQMQQSHRSEIKFYFRTSNTGLMAIDSEI